MRLSRKRFVSNFQQEPLLRLERHRLRRRNPKLSVVELRKIALQERAVTHGLACVGVETARIDGIHIPAHQRHVLRSDTTRTGHIYKITIFVSGWKVGRTRGKGNLLRLGVAS